MKERRDAEHDQRDRRVPRLREIWERFSSRASKPPPFEPNPATMSSRYSMKPIGLRVERTLTVPLIIATGRIAHAPKRG